MIANEHPVVSGLISGGLRFGDQALRPISSNSTLIKTMALLSPSTTCHILQAPPPPDQIPIRISQSQSDDQPLSSTSPMEKRPGTILPPIIMKRTVVDALESGIAGSEQSLKNDEIRKSTALLEMAGRTDRHHRSARTVDSRANRNRPFGCKISQLFRVRLTVAELSVFFALVGVILAVVEAELRRSGTIDLGSTISVILLSAVVSTTIILLIFLIAYYVIDMMANALEQDVLYLTHVFSWIQFGKLLIELIVCGLCPVPYDYNVTWAVRNTDSNKASSSTHYNHVPLNVLLTIPLFMRVYLISRLLVLHNRHYQDAATRSIAALNHVAVDFGFIMKTMMYEHPLKVLILFMAFFFASMAWLWGLCEQYSDNVASRNYLDALWFLAITFFTIGYGDVVPNTYCGRGVAITSGIVGVITSSTVIAVMSRYLELSGSEKRIYLFLCKSELNQTRNILAAKIIQRAWLSYKYKKCNLDRRVQKVARKLKDDIEEFREVKWKMLNVSDDSDSRAGYHGLYDSFSEMMTEMKKHQDMMVSRLDSLQAEVRSLKQTPSV